MAWPGAAGDAPNLSESKAMTHPPLHTAPLRRPRAKAGAIVFLAGISLLICPAASANAGVPIAPAVGFGLWLYLPFLLAIETLVVARLLRAEPSQCFWTVLAANLCSTVLGFPLLLVAVLAFLMLGDFTGSVVWGAVRPHVYERIMRAVAFVFMPELPDPSSVGLLQSRLYMVYAVLIWIVAAFAVSMLVEEWVFRRSRRIAEFASPRQIHRAVLWANLASYAPLILAAVGLHLAPDLVQHGKRILFWAGAIAVPVFLVLKRRELLAAMGESLGNPAGAAPPANGARRTTPPPLPGGTPAATEREPANLRKDA